MRSGILPILMVSLFLVAAALGQSDTSSSSSPANSGLSSASADSGDGQQENDQAPQTATTVSNVPEAGLGTTIRQLGTAFPLSSRPGGLTFGPLTISDVSSSGFYMLASTPGEPSQSLSGTSTSADLIYQHRSGKNIFAFQANPQVSVSGGQAYFNQESSFSFTRQISPRWSLFITNQLAYLQNTQLVNPQTLLAYGSGGFYWQTLYAQQIGATMYDSSNIAATYQLGARTQLSLIPQIGLTFADQHGSLEHATYFGGGASVTHNLSPSRSVSLTYAFTRSSSSEVSPGAPNSRNTQTLGLGVSQQIGRSWWITGNISAAYQSGVNPYWLPVGNIGLLRSFTTGTLIVAYSRSEAAQALVSNGFFDQTDVSYTRSFGRKISMSLGGGAFRTVKTSSRATGKRIGGSVHYKWIHNLSWVLAYNYSTQSGTQPSLNLGDTSYASIGLRWNIGHRPSQ